MSADQPDLTDRPAQVAPVHLTPALDELRSFFAGQREQPRQATRLTGEQQTSFTLVESRGASGEHDYSKGSAGRQLVGESVAQLMGKQLADFKGRILEAHARDYAEFGPRITVTKIVENTHWYGDDKQAIEQAIGEMDVQERWDYLAGRKLSQGADVPGLSEEHKSRARETYQEIHDALSGAANASEMAAWEDQIEYTDGTLISQVVKQSKDNDDVVGAILLTYTNMSETDWVRLKTDPEYRQDLNSALGTLLDGDDLKRAKDALDIAMQYKSFQEFNLGRLE